MEDPNYTTGKESREPLYVKNETAEKAQCTMIEEGNKEKLLYAQDEATEKKSPVEGKHSTQTKLAQNEQCAFCGDAAKKLCSGCKWTWYCSRECQVTCSEDALKMLPALS